MQHTSGVLRTFGNLLASLEPKEAISYQERYQGTTWAVSFPHHVSISHPFVHHFSIMFPSFSHHFPHHRPIFSIISPSFSPLFGVKKPCNSAFVAVARTAAAAARVPSRHPMVKWRRTSAASADSAPSVARLG